MPNSGNREDSEHRPQDQDQDQVYGITTAETSHMQEITRRQKQYILTMLVRVVSIVVVVSVPGIGWPIKIGLCLVATIIPYVAVVRANGGPTPTKDPTNLLVGPPARDELGAAQRGLPAAGEQPGFIKGDFFVKEEGTQRGSGAREAAPARGPADGGARAEAASQGSMTGNAPRRRPSGSGA
ncbi:DUF3099 domain-containing protein [Actinocrinis puniceicyclus]|uniref:DUF3099 domain-containing protein n=1 Tax=Actinocrinis puniceicyclus TaxID=977794 RepID=A0A8J8BE97_9ACTN|nr:DUF3099 domain-containing protein [Actinocrinis puniceicyclus]MBS2964986.1 DUF3099 domain-containing protein [Actinocrinis puniceicyclus]